jgi:hypothetical protein
LFGGGVLKLKASVRIPLRMLILPLVLLLVVGSVGRFEGGGSGGRPNEEEVVADEAVIGGMVLLFPDDPVPVPV